MTEPRWDLIHDAVHAEDDDEPHTRHATTCELLLGIQRRVCTCGLDPEPDAPALDCG